MKGKKAGLIILDGWGIGDGSNSDAVHNAQTPVMDKLLVNYPNARLAACGESVGLPDGQMGNSEVGHLNIGAGRIVYQELTRINKAIKSGDFYEHKVLKEAFELAQKENRSVHFIGLVSEGGVHSSQDHLEALCEMADSYNLNDVFIHAFTDGRDCDPKSGRQFLKRLAAKIEGTSITIQSVIGRYFAMDRDNRWERIKQAYDLMVKGIGTNYSSLDELFDENYEKDVTDEFLPASILTGERPLNDGLIKDNDIVISFNFRTDRPREIVTALTQKAFPDYDMAPLNVALYTMTSYDETFTNVNVIFEKENLKETLGEVLEKEGRTQVRIAETEKYPHVTFFFSGGRETVFEGETRILVNSPKVATYDLQPEMSAPEVTTKIIAELAANTPDFFCLNFANPDMVGHTGVYNAIVKAVETVDFALGKVLEEAEKHGYETVIIADHGNADFAVNPDGSPNTAHSLNLVPVILTTKETNCKLKDGILADVAPTILGRMGIKKPSSMTGKRLDHN